MRRCFVCEEFPPACSCSDETKQKFRAMEDAIDSYLGEIEYLKEVVHMATKAKKKPVKGSSKKGGKKGC